MPFFGDRVCETSISTGTGALLFQGAATGFQKFNSAFAAVDLVPAGIVNSDGVWEVSWCTTTSGALTRVAPISSSDGTFPVAFGSGTKRISSVAPAFKTTLQNFTLFGDGSDGDLTYTSGVATLSTFIHARNLTIASTGVVSVGRFSPLRISGVLDLTAAGQGALYFSGINGTSASHSQGGPNTGALQPFCGPGSQNSQTGGNGSNGAGTNAATQLFSQKTWVPLQGLIIGANKGSSASIPAASVATHRYNLAATGSEFPERHLLPWAWNTSNVNSENCGNPGPSGFGGCGCGGVNVGGGGGAGGVGAGYAVVAAAVISRGASTATGAIQNIGGIGGNGASAPFLNCGGGAAGGGGGGGFLKVIAGALIGAPKTGALDASGGLGGTGGDGNVLGGGGYAGPSGWGGRIQLWDLAANTFTETSGGTNSLAVANIGTLGGIPVAGGFCFADL